MTRRLVIDDYRTFTFEAEYRRDVFTGYNALVNEGPWDEVYWDYDMGILNGDNTRYLAYFIENNPHLVEGDPIMLIHTGNPVGAEVLMDTLGRDWTTKRAYVTSYEADEE